MHVIYNLVHFCNLQNDPVWCGFFVVFTGDESQWCQASKLPGKGLRISTPSTLLKARSSFYLPGWNGFRKRCSVSTQNNFSMCLSPSSSRCKSGIGSLRSQTWTCNRAGPMKLFCQEPVGEHFRSQGPQSLLITAEPCCSHVKAATANVTQRGTAMSWYNHIHGHGIPHSFQVFVANLVLQFRVLVCCHLTM